MARRRCWRLKEVPSFVMPARMLELNFGMTTGFSLISAVRRIQGLETDNGGSGALSYPVGKLFCRKIQAPSGQKGMPPERLQESLWHHLFANPTKWWDHRRSKLTIRSPDFMHKISKVPLWLNNRHKPAWVDPQLADWDAGIRTPPMSLSSSIEFLDDIERLPAHERPSSIGVCRKLCEDGRISDAVDALHILVQQGCHVGNNLFYCVLKSCIAQKDLVMGKRIHALATESGYEGDAFLATHFIGLYASHGMLEEAMQIFRKVWTPTTCNWATIIFAYARHGKAIQAISLYREMLKSTTVKPNNRLYVAILKACATAGDLVAGKEVHTHILASPEKPDSYVQAGLVSMYAKCSSLGDARRMFDTLLEKDVVAWTAMLSGYAQQGMGQEALTLYSSMEQEGVTFPNNVTFVSLLQACASVGVGALEQGKQLHARIQEQGMQEDVVVGGSVVNMYAKCSSLEDARLVFDRLPVKNVVAWTAMLAGYAQQGLGQEALHLYSNMQEEGSTTADSVMFVGLLQACASVGVGALEQGKQLHFQIEAQGLEDDLVLGTSLVNMYSKCDSLEDARQVFDRLPERNVVAWNAMLAGYAQQGMGKHALNLYSSMQEEGMTTPDSVTFVSLLQACAIVGVGALDKGKLIHAQVKEQGLEQHIVVGGSLVTMYAKCGSLGDAIRVFDRLPEKNVVAWTAMLAGYAQQGMYHAALDLHSSMQQEGITTPDSVTFVCLLQACANVGLGALEQGKRLHAQIQAQGVQEDMVLGVSLINMYAKCGSLGVACLVFDRLPERDVVACNAMLAGYAQQGKVQDALTLYTSMQQECMTPPNTVTFVCLLQACASVGIGALDQGKVIHAQVKGEGLEQDVVVGGSLVNMYAKCGSLEDAQRLFDCLLEKNVVAWTAMLAGYTQQGMGKRALNLYRSMQAEGITTPDSVTFVCLLQACASIGETALDQGKMIDAQIKEQGMEDDVVVGGSLVNMYSKCGSLGDARQVFDRLPERDVVAWTAMLAAFVREGMGQEALALYRTMQQGGITTPNSVTFVCLLQACAIVAALPLGKQLHGEIKERGLQADLAVGGGLVNMYAKCGSMSDAQQVFDSLPEKSIEAWNALTSGYARHGDGESVFDLVNRMRLEGIKPDGITFLSVLTVCSHAGNVDKGQKYFEAMKLDYGISPMIEHYTCMVDLLGRAGHLDQALHIAKNMPFTPDIVVWLTLLGACHKWKNVEIAEQAFEYAVRLDGKHASSYVLMSNIYASTEMWEEAEELQVRRKTLGAWKKPGQSWCTDIGGVVHTFVVGDKKHPESEGIYARLDRLVPEMKKAGYVPHLPSSLRDTSDDEKEAESLWHDFFAHPSMWWDHRRSKLTTRSPDFRHKISKVALWLNSRQKPVWVDSQLAAWDAGMTIPPQSVCISIEEQGGIERLGGYEGPPDIGRCRKLCEDGSISDAVDALKILVQQGCHVGKNIFYCVLKRCIAHKNLVMGMRIHALTTESGYAGDAFLATHLMGMYASHGMLEEAMQVFRRVCTPSTYNWATIIFAYAKRGDATEAIRLYRQMLNSTTTKPDNRLYVAVLKACAAADDLVAGKEVHAHILGSPELPDLFVQAGLVSMYAKCGSLGDARRVFDRLPQKDVVAWTAMLAGYAHQGMGQEALSLYSDMQEEGITTPDSVTFVSLLQACASVGVGALDKGKLIHAQVKKQGLEQDLVMGGSLVTMYAKCGSLGDARRVFDRLPEKNVVAWTAMLAGYAHQGMGEEALNLYNSMQQEGITTPDSVTFVCLLQACAYVGVGALNQGKLIHSQIKGQGQEQDVVVGGSLVDMYVKCGSLGDACQVFDRLSERDVVACNAMLAGYAQQGRVQEALTLYTGMQQECMTPPNTATFVHLLQACASVGTEALDQGKVIHAQIKRQGLEQDVLLGGSLVNMYSKCDSLEDARHVFDSLLQRNVVAWNAMLAGYAQHGMGKHALNLYRTMQQEGITTPDSVTFVCLLQACASIGGGALAQGKLIDAQIKERGMEDDVVLGRSLVHMYAKCGSLGDAHRVFDSLPERDVVAWTAMIAGFVREGMGQEALNLYSRMQQQGSTTPNSVTFVCLLQACAILAALPLGNQLHREIKEQELESDPAVGGGLVNMYAKCGSMFDAQQLFDSLPEKSIEAWNALISGYARHGDSEIVFDLVNRMRHEGTKPDGITFLSVLTVCSHAGNVDKGQMYFKAMTLDYGISPMIEHYTCMVDLLGRAGHLDEALQVARNMPFPADSVVWLTLLAACRKWKSVEIGEEAFEYAVSLDGKKASSYVLMSNIYASTEMLEEAEKIQATRKKLGALKQPGQSWWTDAGGVVHTFVVGDKKHRECEGIYASLERVVPEITRACYVPHLHSSLRDISDDEKEAELCGHSEKLAIAYAVICREASRFYIYEGKCSCGDDW